jgi:hypothetical protein
MSPVAKLTSYLGLDPRVRQSGQHSFTATSAGPDRPMPGGCSSRPLRAFHLRIKSRRGANVAVVAVARKLAVLAWHLLTRDADFRWSPFVRTTDKLRNLELAAGYPRRNKRQGVNVGARARRRLDQDRERQVLAQAEAAYVEHVRSRWVGKDAAAPTGERLDGPTDPEPAAARSLIP